jgi:spore coat protein U-like protein
VRDTLRLSRRSMMPPRIAVALAAFTGALPCMAATTCTTSATGVSFGLYNPLSTTPNNTTGTVSVRCQLVSGFFERVNYSVALSTGSSGSFANRTLRSGSNPINYNLYTDAARTQIWGVNGGGTTARAGTMNLFSFAPIAQNDLTIYGRIPAAQYNAVPGNYTDTIVVTVTY